MLNANYKFKILGIEGSSEKYKIALINQENHYNDSKRHVIYVEHFVTNDSKAYLEKLFSETFHNKNICMTGLHACADLSITILDIFIQIDTIKSLVIMPCCYHRLKFRTIENNSEIFENFPKSQTLKSLFSKYNAQEFIRRPFLRNACQHTSSTWTEMSVEDHEKHAKNCLLRAILQKIAVEG